MLRSLVLIIVCVMGAGCSSSREVVVEEPATVVPEVVPIVSSPLPGVATQVVEAVAASYDSTFVAAPAEQAADAHYVEGRHVQARLDSMLAPGYGGGPLQERATASSTVDTTAMVQARLKTVEAIQAQEQRDSTRALVLLGEAQLLFEDALQYNPHHDEARYQLVQIYKIQAQRYQGQRRWDQVLHMLRGLLALNADQHALWAELAAVLDTLGQYEASGLAWLQAATVVLDDARLAFVPEAPAPDSLTLFSYSQRAYSVFVQGRHGAGVRQALSQAITFASNATQHAYATGEQTWALWDGTNFEHRLAFDSLLTVATDDPQGARDGLATLLTRLEQRSSQLEANYNHAILSWQLAQYDQALDTLQVLWGSLGENTQMPYAEFRENLSDMYASLLFQRGLQHRQDGASARAFTYLLMVTELDGHHSGPALIEALKLTRNNPRQARQLEPRIEAVFDQLAPEEQRTYLQLMGNLYRRVGDTDIAQTFLRRYKAVAQ